MAVGWMPTSTCRVAPVFRSIRLTVPDAGAPRSSTRMSRYWLLAVRSPGRGSRPPQLLTIRVASSSESRGSNGQVLDRVFLHRLPAWRGRPRRRHCDWRRPRRAASRRGVIAIPPGTGLADWPGGVMVILAPVRSLEPASRNTWMCPRSVLASSHCPSGVQSQTAEPCAWRRALTSEPAITPGGRGQEARCPCSGRRTGPASGEAPGRSADP